MNDFTKKYSKIWKDDPKKLLKSYDYQLELTKQLDNLSIDKFDRKIFYEIILWKLNRYPQIDNTLIEKLKPLSSLKPKEHYKSKQLLKELLSCRGIRLPMASTILRFINPNVFQIIDDRVFRVLELEGKIPTKPKNINNNYLEKSCEIYFHYLDRLRDICNEKLPFEDSDRILYLLDIKLENKIGD
jgi:thermostable 8-oxoguanine DNA glycosylase